MKFFKCSALFLCAIILLCSCSVPANKTAGGDPPPDYSSSSLSEEYSSSDEDTPTAADATQTVGTDEVGWLTVPDNWVSFKDIDGGTDLQYSDPAGSQIITLSVVSTDGMTDEQIADLNAESAANAIGAALEEDDVTDLQGAQVTLAGYEAYQVNGSYVSEDAAVPSVIVCWLFENGSKIHFVSAEGPAETISDVVAFVEGSYTLAAATA